MAGLLDLVRQYGAGVKERVGLLGRDPVEYTRQALLDVLPSDAEAKAAKNMLMGGEVDRQAYQDYLAKIQNMGNFVGSLKVDGGLLQMLANRSKVAARNATAPANKGGLALSSRNTAEQRMTALGMERGWYRGGEAPQVGVSTPPTGRWYTRSVDAAEDYARRAKAPDVREYAIPAKTLDMMEQYPPEVARKIGRQLADSSNPKLARFGQEYLKAADAGPVDGRALFQGLHNTFGVDVASDVLKKAGFSGVRNWNQAGDAFVFPGEMIRDARAPFDPWMKARDDIYGAASIKLLGAIAAGSSLGLIGSKLGFGSEK